MGTTDVNLYAYYVKHVPCLKKTFRNKSDVSSEGTYRVGL
jgi:hypothetical protein